MGAANQYTVRGPGWGGWQQLPDSSGPREWVLAGITVLFAGTGAWAAVVWRRKARNKPAFLATTVAELKRDRAALGGHGP